MTQPIPVVLLTGFLGSGKTTLLNRLLADPACGDTAVMINELGAVGLDDRLVARAARADGALDADAAARAEARERMSVLLAGGCICCTVGDDLQRALDDLLERRSASGAPPFSRIVIETTGIAHPVPVIASINLAATLSGHCLLERVVCTVDAVAGTARIDRHPECMAQIVVADDLLVTRTDLASGPEVEALEARLTQLNPTARRMRVTDGRIDPAELFDPASVAWRAGGRPVPSSGGLLASSARLHPLPGASAHRGVQADTLRFGGRTVWSTALEGIERVARDKGDALLRIKGVLRLDGHPEPMVVQWAGGRISPLEPLPGALAPDDAGYLVVISDAGSG